MDLKCSRALENASRQTHNQAAITYDLDEGAIDLTDDTAPAPSAASPTPNSSADTTQVPQKPVVGAIKLVPLALLQKNNTFSGTPEAKKIILHHNQSKHKVWTNKDTTVVTRTGQKRKKPFIQQSIIKNTRLSKYQAKKARKAAKLLALSQGAHNPISTLPYPQGQVEPSDPSFTQLEKLIMDKNILQWGPGLNNYQKGIAGIPKSFLLAAEARLQSKLAEANFYQMKPAATSAYNFPEVYKGVTPVPSTSQNKIPASQTEQELTEREDSESPVMGGKRLSAFERLGPVTQPKKPKLTINLLFSKEQSIREVVNIDTKEEYIPVHKRNEVLTSTHEVILKYLAVWPWRVEVHEKKTVGPRESKTAMLMEEEQMAEYYEMPTVFIKIVIHNCPKDYTKETALDLILEQLKDYSFIPCFIDMKNGTCTFLVIKCAEALLALHKCGLRLEIGDQSLPITIAVTYLKQNVLNFVPKLILRKMVVMGYDEKKKSLNLEEFSMQSDISNFIYFPLNRIQNQIEFLQLQAVPLSNLVELNLAHNKITSIDGFNLGFNARRLKRLDLSFNYLEKMTMLLPCRNLLLESLNLEGNPLCNDYTDPELYKKTAHLLFPCLKELDGVQIFKSNEIPQVLQTFCPPEAKGLIEKVLETFYPALDSSPEERICLDDMYHTDAILTITFMSRLRSASIFRYGREMFARARCLEEENMEQISGAKAIVKHYTRWPKLKHDPLSFTIDVLLHEEYTTIFRVGGIMKAVSERLADDEHLLAFTRTLVLHSTDGVEYKIHNEMIFFDEPTRQCLEKAFQVNLITRPRLLKFDSNPDAAVKESLIVFLSELTELGKKRSERCLAQKKWDLRAALEYFMALLKLNCLSALDQD